MDDIPILDDMFGSTNSNNEQSEFMQSSSTGAFNPSVDQLLLDEDDDYHRITERSSEEQHPMPGENQSYISLGSNSASLSHASSPHSFQNGSYAHNSSNKNFNIHPCKKGEGEIIDHGDYDYMCCGVKMVLRLCIAHNCPVKLHMKSSFDILKRKDVGTESNDENCIGGYCECRNLRDEFHEDGCHKYDGSNRLFYYQDITLCCDKCKSIYHLCPYKSCAESLKLDSKCSSLTSSTGKSYFNTFRTHLQSHFYPSRFKRGSSNSKKNPVALEKKKRKSFVQREPFKSRNSSLSTHPSQDDQLFKSMKSFPDTLYIARTPDLFSFESEEDLSVCGAEVDCKYPENPDLILANDQSQLISGGYASSIHPNFNRACFRFFFLYDKLGKDMLIEKHLNKATGRLFENGIPINFIENGSIVCVNLDVKQYSFYIPMNEEEKTILIESSYITEKNYTVDKETGITMLSWNTNESTYEYHVGSRNFQQQQLGMSLDSPSMQHNPRSIIRILKENMSDLATVILLFEALIGYLEKEENENALLETGIFTTVTRVMGAFDDDERILSLGCKILFMLSRKKSNSMQLRFTAGAIDLIKRIQSRYPSLENICNSIIQETVDTEQELPPPTQSSQKINFSVGLSPIELLIVDKANKGSFGEIVSVKRQSDSQIYSFIKIASSSLSRSDISDISNEVKSALEIKHHNILSVYGFNSSIYAKDSSGSALGIGIVLDNCELGTLKHVFSSNVSLTKAILVKLLIDVGNSIAYLHNTCTPSIVHGAICSETVFITNDCHAKLGFTGLSKTVILASANMKFMESVYSYSAPEIFTRNTRSIKSDIYSFAALILETLYGIKLWKGIGSNEIMRRSLELQRPPELRDLSIIQDEMVKVIIEKSLDMEESLRPTIEEIQNALKQYQETIQ